MPIPGLKTTFETRAKVRIGEKRGSQGGREFPVAVDYFVCDDAEFQQLYAGKPSVIRIVLPYADVDDVFPTGMEWWMGKLLACYSDKADGTALRRAEVEQGGQKRSLLGNVKVLDQTPVGQDRRRVECKFRDCPDFGKNAANKKCRVMGRLRFFLKDGRRDQVLELGTKSWNTIEEITRDLNTARASGPLTGREFKLSVAFRGKGRDRYPVVSIEEVVVEPNSPADMGKLDALLVIDRGLSEQKDPRRVLADALDQLYPDGWKDNEKIVARIKEVGAPVALQNLKTRLQAETA